MRFKSTPNWVANEKAIHTVQRRLIKWWLRCDCEGLFPWRCREISPYHALITEVLLQRTRAEAVNAVYHDFFDRFPDADALCTAPVSEIRKAIASLGLLWRAEKLKALGCAVSAGIPDDQAELAKLPCVGPYASGAYLSLHRGIRAVIPDANMVRVLGRLFGFPTTPETRRKKAFLDLCEKVTPKQRFREFNYAVLDHGRGTCKPQKPLCYTCFLNDICSYGRECCPKQKKSKRSRCSTSSEK